MAGSVSKGAAEQLCCAEKKRWSSGARGKAFSKTGRGPRLCRFRLFAFLCFFVLQRPEVPLQVHGRGLQAADVRPRLLVASLHLADRIRAAPERRDALVEKFVLLRIRADTGADAQADTEAETRARWQGATCGGM